ncbi:MAG: nucleotidyl transferase AbiEii/AbiGii toxin family protein [Bacteroidales bacterium]|nr:nucleotidyl transferase AbiEii/AbiGii toxin family protein [Bacteroidales bacterium]
MNNYFSLSREQQRLLLSQTAAKVGLPEQAVEKDLWVTVILQLVFTLPYAGKLVFKGGTTLAKAGLIERFSEDIDLAINRSQFGVEGDLTKKQQKALRKESSLFVRDVLSADIKTALLVAGLDGLCEVVPEPDGEGDNTYPEPRKIHMKYHSVFGKPLPYLRPEVMLEVGARSLIEPFKPVKVESFVTQTTPVNTTVADVEIPMAEPRKTFLEKAFLLHELFSTGEYRKAERKSRHIYDLAKMMSHPEILSAIKDDQLWNSIHHHRQVFTPLRDVDYTPDIRDRICLIPPENCLGDWKSDYQSMCESMIYESDPLPFDTLIDRMKELEKLFQLRHL